ncbi:MAG: hypothetical protein RL742_1754, partial [Bacteroidota bacterium]
MGADPAFLPFAVALIAYLVSGVRGGSVGFCSAADGLVRIFRTVLPGGLSRGFNGLELVSPPWRV